MQFGNLTRRRAASCDTDVFYSAVGFCLLGEAVHFRDREKASLASRQPTYVP